MAVGGVDLCKTSCYYGNSMRNMYKDRLCIGLLTISWFWHVCMVFKSVGFRTIRVINRVLRIMFTREISSKDSTTHSCTHHVPSFFLCVQERPNAEINHVSIFTRVSLESLARSLRKNTFWWNGIIFSKKVIRINLRGIWVVIPGAQLMTRWSWHEIDAYINYISV